MEAGPLRSFRLLFGLVALVSAFKSLAETNERYLTPQFHFPFFILDGWGAFSPWLLGGLLLGQFLGSAALLSPDPPRPLRWLFFFAIPAGSY